MTDFEYECYQKKNIAHSASRRKCGSKSKKCNLSTDYMTEKQWKERCGDVMSYQIGKPMTWSEFRKLPSDLKEEYMNALIDKYSANARSFADMFGVSVATIFRAVKNDNLSVKFAKGRYPSGEKEVAFKKFLSGEDVAAPKKDESIPVNEVKADHPDAELAANPGDASVPVFAKEDTNKPRFDSFTMNFSGKIDVDMIANSLRYILPFGGNAKIHISCEIE